MHIFPPQIEIGDEEGFSDDKDIFELKEFGQGLMHLNERVEDPLVIALDGPWGSGKTTFIKMWLGLLRNNGFPVIYFDAFANDHIDDAFIAIAGEVVALAEELTDDKKKAFMENAKGVFKVLLRSGVKVGVKALTAGLLDKEAFEGLESISGDAVKETSEITDSFLQAQLENHAKDRDVFKAFRIALESIATELAKKSVEKITPQEDSGESALSTPNRPLIFVIDELDRCKPTFALALLERIKHFFSVSKVNFVLVTNLDQLKNSVMYSYGNRDEEARMYLQKFYYVAISLPEKKQSRGKSHIDGFLSYIFNDFPEFTTESVHRLSIVTSLSSIAEIRGYSLRTIEKISTRIALVLASADKRQLALTPLITCLCAFKIDCPELFKKAQDGTIDLNEVEEFFVFSKWKKHVALHETLAHDLWKYCLGSGSGDINIFMGQNRFHEWKNVLPATCKLIEGLKFSEDS